MQRHWSAYPAALKPDADRAFCDGANHFIWHTFTASPPEFGKPGIEYFAGTHINPNVTWWNQAGPFLAYLARCQFLLRQGRFVADVCCYTGDKPYMHWGRGNRWSAKASLTLGKGYTYDVINTEVLLSRMSVERGDLVLPDGMRYRLLVVDLDDDAVPSVALQKIIALAKAGATIVLGSGRPDRAPGLRAYPASDAEVGRSADELWGKAGQQVERRPLGQGEVSVGVALDKVLQTKGIRPDIVGPWNYSHRQAEGTDLYFLAGVGKAECVFRVSGKTPALWDAVTGNACDAAEWHATDDGRTAVSISLPENGSCFVVFRKPAGAAKTTPVASLGDVPPLPLLGPWQVRFQPDRGAPPSAVFEKLLAWNKHPEPGIKYFSGTATYKKTFDLTAEQAAGPVRLQLGIVKNIAEVRVNGKPLGIVWTAPWAVDLTGQIKPGQNDLEIDVTNLWINRLIGDAGLPPERRLTKTNVVLQRERGKLRPYEGFAADDPLEPSGLLGPVQLEFDRQP